MGNCGVSEKRTSHTRNTQAPLPHSRPRLEAAYSLHRFGIRHCRLNKEENFILHGDKVYIVDFSEAKTRCGCEMTKDRVMLCPELKQMEEQLGDGKTNDVLKEIGVPPEWRACLKQDHQAFSRKQIRQPDCLASPSNL